MENNPKILNLVYDKWDDETKETEEIDTTDSLSSSPDIDDDSPF